MSNQENTRLPALLDPVINEDLMPEHLRSYRWVDERTLPPGINTSVLPRQNGKVRVPVPHLSFQTEEEGVGELLTAVERAREEAWRICDICARLRYLYPEDGGLVRRLAAALGKTPTTVYRYIQMGNTFPPEVRNYELSLNVYLAALETKMHPLEAIQVALDEDEAMTAATFRARLEGLGAGSWSLVISAKSHIGSEHDVEALLGEIGAALRHKVLPNGGPVSLSMYHFRLLDDERGRYEGQNDGAIHPAIR